MTKIVITGHRNIINGPNDEVRKKLKTKISELVKVYKNVHFEVGQAEGSDQVAIEVLKENKHPYKLLPQQQVSENIDVTPFYEAQAKDIVASCDHLIAVWDGTFNYKLGGTSDIVKKAMEADRPIQIHHLVTPREDNLHPIHSLNEDIIDFQNGQFNRIPFAINYSWISFKNEASLTKKKKKKRLLGFLGSSFFWRFIFPIILVIATLVLGYKGFSICETDQDAFDNFFDAANLLTLNSSALGYDVGFFSMINIARFLGLIFLIYAFV